MAIQVTVNISDDDEKFLLNDLLDINDWVQKAVIGKVNNCMKRMARDRKQQLVDRGDLTIPATDRALALNATADPAYKNRAQREAARAQAR